MAKYNKQKLKPKRWLRYTNHQAWIAAVPVCIVGMVFDGVAIKSVALLFVLIIGGIASAIRAIWLIDFYGKN